MLKRNISSINSWSDLKNLLDTKTKQEKGQAFEELTKYFLEYNPVYKTKLKHIWLHKEIPSSVSKKLNLPSNDQGIDLIAETFEGTYWAIQCKYLQDEDQRLSHRAISTFISLSTGIAKDITYCLVCTTVDEYAKIYQGKENIGFVNSDEWRKLDKEFFDWLRNKLSGKEKNLIPYKPKPHQTKALQEAKSYFTKENNPRGKLVFPCGAGKSLTGYWITRELKSKSIIVAVPSLSLVKQTLEVYLRESVANNDKVSWLCVCSDEGIGTNDDIAIHTNEIGVPCVTDKNYIAKWIKNNSKNKTIIFTTYQSGKTISEACKIAKHEFDLGIMDEAHKTVGDKDKLFSHLLFDQNIKIKKRIFMTATERRYAGSSDLVLSMDDVNVYGDTFTQMSFKEAIEIGILSDYRIITLFISNDEVKSLIEKNAFVKPTGKEWDQETEARTLASLIALRKAMTEYPIHHAVTFHSSIKKAEAFEQSQSVFSKAYPKFAKVESFHVSGAMPTSRRGKIVDEFAQTNKGIITNAKCLTEGVDVPNIDCVLFADPRKSTVDIVQAVGRALRKKDGKDFGYVILPVFTESNNTDEIINSDEFKEILSTIRALASNDERIIEYFKDVSKGVKKNKKDSLVHFDIDVQLSERINEKELIDSIQLKTWDKLAKLSWMPFEEARNFVHSLKLKSRKEWDRFSKSDKRPLDIPMNPNGVYKNNGWISVGDWLGTGRIADQYKKYRPFHLAKEYVQSLNLIDRNDWIKYCRSGKKPDDIPTSPNKTYENKGWKGLKDWLGTGTSEFRNFGEAKKYASSLHLNSESDWKKHTKSKEFPIDVPLYPQGAYKNKGWKSWGDFLGTGYIANIKREYKSFIDAREFVKNLHLKGEKEWRAYLKTKKKPNNIPSDPASVYKDEWKGMGDFLGTGTISPRLREYLPYEEARIFARLLDLKSRDQWKAFCKSGKKPANIPETPDQVYKSSWKGMGDFLGTGNIAPSLIQYKSFDEAKQFVRTKGIKTYPEWKIFCESGQRPKDIPSNPNATYKDKWKGFKDFFGTEIEYLDFDKAREIVRREKLRLSEWENYCKSRKPINIPPYPQQKYKNKGWKSWTDFLGNENRTIKRKEFASYVEARDFAKKQNLYTVADWRSFCKSGKKPINIPSDPHKIYKVEWAGWIEFLGAYNKPKKPDNILSYSEAKKFVQKLNLRSQKEWQKYAKTKRPDNLPSSPDRKYEGKGWINWEDFLGYDMQLKKRGRFKSFSEARNYVRRLKLSTHANWKKLEKDGRRPKDIPSKPNYFYNNEWKGWDDFLGK